MLEGRGLRYYRPEEVEISLNFYTKTNSYETMSAQEIITNIFTQEDIEVSEKLYCLWITN